jgi:hypothetical protein
MDIFTTQDTINHNDSNLHLSSSGLLDSTQDHFSLSLSLLSPSPLRSVV